MPKKTKLTMAAVTGSRRMKGPRLATREAESFLALTSLHLRPTSSTFPHQISRSLVMGRVVPKVTLMFREHHPLSPLPQCTQEVVQTFRRLLSPLIIGRRRMTGRVDKYAKRWNVLGLRLSKSEVSDSISVDRRGLSSGSLTSTFLYSMFLFSRSAILVHDTRIVVHVLVRFTTTPALLLSALSIPNVALPSVFNDYCSFIRFLLS